MVCIEIADISLLGYIKDKIGHLTTINKPVLI
jgi:hypothetical protein